MQLVKHLTNHPEFQGSSAPTGNWRNLGKEGNSEPLLPVSATVGPALLNFLPPPPNEGKSAASFCCQVAVWFPEMFCNFYLVKNQAIAKTSTTTKAREKISIESLKF